jgi:hypothetical protein
VAQPMAMAQPVPMMPVVQPMAMAQPVPNPPQAQVQSQSPPQEQPQPKQMVLQIKVPPGVNAGQSFPYQMPDEKTVQLNCPTPFPAGGKFAYAWTGIPAPVTGLVELTVPKGVGAGQRFKTTLQDGREVHPTCPTPFPRGAKFMYTVPAPGAEQFAMPPSESRNNSSSACVLL